MAQTQSDTALAAQQATMPDALSLHTLSVIGLIEAHDGPAALLRSSRGDVARVHVGDEAFGVRVTAIGPELVLLTDRWGRTQSLQLPQS